MTSPLAPLPKCGEGLVKAVYVELVNDAVV